MSEKSQTIQPPAQPSATLNPEVISLLTEKLAEIAQSLKAASQPEKAHARAPEDAPQPRNEPGEIRCYHVPGYIIEEERETLKKYKAEDLMELMYQASGDVHLTAYLLRNFNDSEEVTGETLNNIGERLAYPLAIFRRLCSIFADYKLQTTN